MGVAYYKLNPRFTREWGWRPRIRFWRKRWKKPANDNNKSSAFSDPYLFANALKAKGFEKLGGGAFSSVYGKPGSDRVIKVIRNPKDGWIDYVKWANDNGFAGNVAPRVYSFKEIQTKNPENKFAIASMERLNKTIRDTENEHDLKVVPPLFRMAVETDNQNAKLLLDLVQPNLNDFGQKFKEAFGFSKSSNNYHGRFGFDLHEGNFMLRGDNQIVVTDPVCHTRTTTFTKMKFAA